MAARNDTEQYDREPQSTYNVTLNTWERGFKTLEALQAAGYPDVVVDTDFVYNRLVKDRHPFLAVGSGKGSFEKALVDLRNCHGQNNNSWNSWTSWNSSDPLNFRNRWDPWYGIKVSERGRGMDPLPMENIPNDVTRYRESSAKRVEREQKMAEQAIEEERRSWLGLSSNASIPWQPGPDGRLLCRINATNLAPFAEYDLPGESDLLFNCPWDSGPNTEEGTATETLLRGFLKSAAKVQAIGSYVFIGITEHYGYFPAYGIQNVVTGVQGYRLRCLDTGIISKVLEKGYEHHSNVPNTDIGHLIYGYHVMLCFERQFGRDN
ncbi:hypothetical protein BDR26DRAFT_880537 [Obelidium mucronatum]|nr:hypothetical protein BDR26DRAFT_880537 [Obelidium mucronatum]